MKNKSKIPIISIVGRPNVGKSSLFNWFLRQRRAVVVEESGTTRDRVEEVVIINDKKVKIADTGGYLAEDKDKISMLVKQQIYDAMKEATIMIMVVDAQTGLSPADEEIASILRKFSKKIIIVANKADNEKIKQNALEFYRLGLGSPVAISCLHRKGINGLKSDITNDLKDFQYSEKKEEESNYIKIAIVGRPNVGKSSFVNYVLRRERLIVSDIPGTTRDSIDTHFSYDGDDFILIDTAGIRHKRKVKTPVDVFSMMRSQESIKRSDVVLLLIDAQDGVTKDDMGILDLIEENGKACLILVNKWDLANTASDVNANDYREHLLSSFPRFNKFSVEFISSITGKNILKSLISIKKLNEDLDMKISTPLLNKIFEKNNPANVPVPRSKKKPNFLYIVQSKKRPIEFKYFVNDTSAVGAGHLSFIENKLRNSLPLAGIPIKIRFIKSRKDKK